MNAGSPAHRVLERIEQLSRISEAENILTRTYGSPAMRHANELVAGWMREAGMEVRSDAVGNLIGRLPGKLPELKTFILGSHLDTVRDAGKFDGALGVVAAIECVAQLRQQQITLPFALEVVGFADEEGVRFQTTYLGSRALAGALTEADLERRDANGISLREAIRQFGGNPDALEAARRSRNELHGYAEVHIEQGPVLETKGQAVGVVSAIAGQTRILAEFAGRAGHAGTTPMSQRKDALCGAAELILDIERVARTEARLVATAGQITVTPGASNVIPGTAALTLDVRHQDDPTRAHACSRLWRAAERIAQRRNLQLTWQIVQETPAVPCSRELTERLAASVRCHQGKGVELPSGAGHDAAIMGSITQTAMLFVRCKEGISHHPDESVNVEDIDVAIRVLCDFVKETP